MTTYTVWVTRVWGRGTWDEEVDEHEVTVQADSEAQAEAMAIAIVIDEQGYAPAIEAFASVEGE